MHYQVTDTQSRTEIDMLLCLCSGCPSYLRVKGGDVDLAQREMAADGTERANDFFKLLLSQKQLVGTDNRESEFDLYSLKAVFHSESGEILKQPEVACSHVFVGESTRLSQDTIDFPGAYARRNPESRVHALPDKYPDLFKGLLHDCLPDRR